MLLTPRHDGPRAKNITFGKMRASGVRDVPIYCRESPLLPFDHDERPIAGRAMVASS